MQLAFIIFTQLHNFSALDSYKSLLSLFSRSISVFLPSSNGLPPVRSIPLYISLLDEVLLPHIEHLRAEFFEQDLPGLDGFIQEEVANLRISLRAAYRHYFPESTQTGRTTAQVTISQSSDEDNNLSIQFKKLCEAWERLRIASENRFGWLFGRLEPDDVTLLRQQKGRIEYNLLAEADEDDEYREEGDDAPVVVEL
jgi:A1 cistron-splicing factor AAR2